MKKTPLRARRAKRTRKKILEQGKVRLTVHKTPRHIYAQIFSADGSQVLASASSIDKELRTKDFGKGKLKMAEAVGELIAARAKAKGISVGAFDRSGFIFHGRIKQLADSARKSGLEF